MVFNAIAAIVIGYLLGAIPFAYITARLIKGIDIRQVGGGNVGAMNVYREAGPVFGVAVLAADLAKGVLAVIIALWLDLSLIWVCVAGFAAVVGHNWPVFLGFRGGRGAATIMGVLLAFMPVQFAIGFGIAAVIVVISGNVRLGIIGLVCIPLIAWLYGRPPIYIYYPLALILFLAIYALIGARGELARAEVKKKVIFKRDFNFWQTKRKE